MKRATFGLILIISFRPHFNPRPREEGDSRFIVYIITYLCISIHALVKRATTPIFNTDRQTVISIHALVKRATYQHCKFFTTFNISIHALVKRATFLKRSYRPKQSISIHALVKRATHEKTPPLPVLSISIHALVKRATALFPREQHLIFYFNPRPREEGDHAPEKLPCVDT